MEQESPRLLWESLHCSLRPYHPFTQSHWGEILCMPRVWKSL
ncbi:mCG67939, isoform CRA_a [Mus musculus]|nr:mCG67939, isoform CRA_a [Mus musculus]